MGKLVLRKSASAWEREFRVTIVDPDGWDRRNFEASWAELLTREEFEARMMRSTVLPWREGQSAPGL